MRTRPDELLNIFFIYAGCHFFTMFPYSIKFGALVHHVLQKSLLTQAHRKLVILNRKAVLIYHTKCYFVFSLDCIDFKFGTKLLHNLCMSGPLNKSLVHVNVHHDWISVHKKQTKNLTKKQEY